jgi:hypothetical protein
LDFAIVTALIFFLWLAAKKTKKLLKRLEPDEKIAQREMIIIKADLSNVQNTHLVEPVEEPASQPEPAAAKAFEARFEVEPAAAEPWKEFTWEPEAEAEAELTVG